MQQKKDLKMSMEDSMQEPTKLEDTPIPIGETSIIEPWERQTPSMAFEELEKKHVPEGHEPHWCNPKHRERTGWEGWQKVKSKKKPDIMPDRSIDSTEIRVGDSILCSMPKEKAAKRTAYFQGQGQKKEDKRKEIKELAKDRLKTLMKGRTIMSYAK